MRNNTHSGNNNKIGIAKSREEGLRPKAGVQGPGRSLCSGGTPFPHLHTCNAGVKRACPSLCPAPTQWLETSGLISRVPFILLASAPIPTAAQDSHLTSQGSMGLYGAPLPLPCGASPHIPHPYFLWSSMCLSGSPSPEWKVQEGCGFVYFVQRCISRA